MDRALPTYQRDDGRSWWAKTADGADRCVRMQFFHEHSPTTVELLAGDAFAAHRPPHRRRVRAPAHREPHRSARQADRCRRGHLRRSVAQGLLARDALVQLLQPHGRHLGHRRRRPARASSASSPVRTARSCSPPSSGRESALPVIDLPTLTGDATLHCSCTLHTAATSRRPRAQGDVHRLRPAAARSRRRRAYPRDRIDLGGAGELLQERVPTAGGHPALLKPEARAPAPNDDTCFSLEHVRPDGTSGRTPAPVFLSTRSSRMERVREENCRTGGDRQAR